MYNPYMPGQYYPQQGIQQNYQQNFQQNYLPQQNVIQVDGQQSANNIKMAPNSSIIVTDKNLPMIYMCLTDGLGNVSVSAYDISPHQETPPVDIKSIEQRLSDLEKAMNKMEERKNGKPDDTRSNGKQNSPHKESV